MDATEELLAEPHAEYTEDPVAEEPTCRATPFDKYIGEKIRAIRLMRGLSQSQLASMINVTYQQMHKYERGLNRVSAGRLWEFSCIFKVPVSTFYEGISDGTVHEMPEHQRSFLDLARNFGAIESDEARTMICSMARLLAGQPAVAPEALSVAAQ